MKSVIKTTLITSALTLSLASLNAASADVKPASYAGASLSQVTGKNYYDDAPNPKMGLLSIDAGFKFNPYLAAEIRVGTGIKNASHSWTATDKGTSSQKRVIGLYVKGILPINSLFSAYGLVGYTHGTNHFKETDTGYYNSVDTSDSSPSYGIGANINATKQVSVNLEYAHLYNEKAYGVTTKYEALTLGVNYQF